MAVVFPVRSHPCVRSHSMAGELPNNRRFDLIPECKGVYLYLLCLLYGTVVLDAGCSLPKVQQPIYCLFFSMRTGHVACDSGGFALCASTVGTTLRLNCIQTDHKAVMARMEKSLHALHQVGFSAFVWCCRCVVLCW